MTTTPNPENQVLEPCPFDGGKAILGMFNVWCAKCEASTKKDIDATTEEKIARWNARVRAGGEAPEALRRAVKLCRSGIAGEKSTKVELLFDELKDAQTVHQWLCSLATTPTAGDAPLCARCGKPEDSLSHDPAYGFKDHEFQPSPSPARAAAEKILDFLNFDTQLGSVQADVEAAAEIIHRHYDKGGR